MKESRFIELLNLYVDQELSPAEAVELESEIASHPARRSRYEQYCRMQRGCSLLFESTRAQAPTHPNLINASRAADAKVSAFPSAGALVPANPFLRRMVWGSGGLAAAAACIALVLVQQSEVPAGLNVADAPPPVVKQAPAAVAQQTPPVTRPEARTPIERNRPSDYQLATLFNASDPATASLFSDLEHPDFEWMRQVELSMSRRSPVESLRFEIDRHDSQVPASIGTQPASLRLNEEFNAFEFRR